MWTTEAIGSATSSSQTGRARLETCGARDGGDMRGRSRRIGRRRGGRRRGRDRSRI